MLKGRLTEEPDGRVALETPFHAELVDWLRTLPSGGRSWDPDRKRWLVSALYVDELLAALQQLQFSVQDDRISSLMAPGQDAAAVWSPVGYPADLASAFYQLGLCGECPLELANYVYHWWSRLLHPDKGGDAEQFNKVSSAIAVIRKYLAEE